MEERTYQGFIYRRNGPGEPWQRVGAAPQAAPQAAPGGGVVIGTPRPVNPAPEIRAQNADTRAEAQLELARAAAARADASAAREAARFAQEQAENAEKASGRPGAGVTALMTLGRVIGQIDAIRNDVAGDGQTGWGETGFTGSTLRDWAGTAAYDLQRAINTIDANSAFSALAEMRAASPTGAALGQVTEKELELLKSTIASLDPDQGQETFLSQLDIARRHYQTLLSQAAMDVGPEEKQTYLNSLIAQNAPPEEVRAAAHAIQGQNNPDTNAWLQRYEQGNRDPVTIIPSATNGAPPSDGGINPSQADLQARDGNPFDSYLRSAANMATAGFGNKIVAGINSVLPIDRLTGRPVSSVWDGRSFTDALNPFESIARLPETFNRNLALETRTTNADRIANPAASLAGDATGGALAAVGAMRYMPTTASLSTFAPRAMAFDATYGASVGGNEAFDRGQSVLPSAAAGAGIGLLGGAVGRGVIAPALAAAGRTRPGQAAANALLSVANVPRNAVRGMTGRSPVPAPRMTAPPTVSPQQQMLVDNAADPAALTQTLTEADRLGLPMALADTSPALRRLAGAAFRRSGDDVRNAAEATVRDRSLGQADRALGQLDANFGTFANPNRESERLMALARARSGPLYDAAFMQPAPVGDEALQAMLSTPAGRSALAQARTIAQNEGVNPDHIGLVTDELGNVSFSQTPTFRTLDYVKKGFDAILEPQRLPNGMMPTDPATMALQGLRTRFRSRLDELNPDYASARAAFAGPASSAEAMRSGVDDSMRMMPRDIEDAMARYTPEQADQFRLGNRVAMGDMVARSADTRNPYTSLYGSPIQRERLGAMYHPTQVERFGRVYDLEGEMGRTSQELLGGSPTAARMMADQQFGDDMLGHVGNAAVDIAATGAPVRSILAAGRQMLGDRMQLGLGQAAQRRADAILPTLLDTNPASARAMMEEAIANSAQDQAYRRQMRRIGGMFGAGAAGTALPLLSQ
jgi:hypothetical protein